MTTSAASVTHFSPRDWESLEHDLDERLSTAGGLVGVAVIDLDRTIDRSPAERLAEHLEPEDYAVQVTDNRFVIVRSPLIGPAEIEGLGLRIADSFPERRATNGPIPKPGIHIGVVVGRRGDPAGTLLRHAAMALDDARVIGRPIVAVDDRPVAGLMVSAASQPPLH